MRSDRKSTRLNSSHSQISYAVFCLKKKKRLLAAGMRPITNVVDITNYVMLAVGNPLHAFDFEALAGGKIVVRRARPNETLRTLDGVDRRLDPDDLLIADAERAIALAGIMGGEETEIGERTTKVLLEAANFEPFTIFKTSERLRLRTEGSNRWEKGVDPYLAAPAAELATQLLLDLAGADWTAHTDAHGGLPERPVVRYRPERADAVIGLETPADDQYALLGRLGFDRDDGKVIVPTWRARDVTREIDVVEEIARFRLEDVPFTLPSRLAMFGALTREQQLRRRVEDALVGLGFAETYTPSLVPAAETPWKLPEPTSPASSPPRTSRWSTRTTSASPRSGRPSPSPFPRTFRSESSSPPHARLRGPTSASAACSTCTAASRWGRVGSRSRSRSRSSR